MKQKYVKYIPLLEKLGKAKPKKRAQMLKECDPEVVRLILEAIFNILKGNIKLTDQHYKKLSPYKRTLLFLAKKKKSLDAKPAHLKKGGAAILPLLLPTVITLVSSLLNSK